MLLLIQFTHFIMVHLKEFKDGERPSPKPLPNEDKSSLDFFFNNWYYLFGGFFVIQLILGIILYRLLQNRKLREQKLELLNKASKIKSRRSSKVSKTSKTSATSKTSRKWPKTAL